jgi:2-polyprenyl-3-methyl-5-hydroxy-6-metoxy-1,4-benzoquinol methylase
MSIFTGKAGYDSWKAWAERSDVALLQSRGEYNYETDASMDDPAAQWVRGKLSAFSVAPDVLDVGAGFGGWSVKLSGAYTSYVGADVTRARVEHARILRGANRSASFYHIADAEWSLGRLFPVVISITVIQHLTVPTCVDVLRGIERHLQREGVALLAEGRILDCDVQEAEKIYARSENAPHMIPKPLSLLRAAVPGLDWTRESSTHFALRKG